MQDKREKCHNGRKKSQNSNESIKKNMNIPSNLPRNMFSSFVFDMIYNLDCVLKAKNIKGKA